MPVPPTLVRRLVVAPLVLALEVALIVASPLLALIAILLAPLAGGSRPLRALAIAVDFAARHAATTLACLGLWLTRRHDREAHYDLMRWFVGGVYRTMVRIARVEVRVTDSDDVVAALDAAERPAVVLARHAGEGDSLLVLHALLCRHRRRPRLVLHEALRFDPVIDVLGRRLPNRFVDPRGGDTEVEIAAMSGDLDPGSAVLIFPEGANFTPERRRRGIERLEEAGHERGGRLGARDGARLRAAAGRRAGRDRGGPGRRRRVRRPRRRPDRPQGPVAAAAPAPDDRAEAVDGGRRGGPARP